MNDRRAKLLDEMRKRGGKWNTGRVWDLYREMGIAPKKSTARDDVAHLKRTGYLDQEGNLA